MTDPLSPITNQRIAGPPKKPKKRKRSEAQPEQQTEQQVDADVFEHLFEQGQHAEPRYDDDFIVNLLTEAIEEPEEGFVPALKQRKLDLRFRAAATRRSVQDTPTLRMQRRNVRLRIAAAIDLGSDSD